MCQRVRCAVSFVKLSVPSRKHSAALLQFELGDFLVREDIIMINEDVIDISALICFKDKTRACHAFCDERECGVSECALGQRRAVGEG